MKDERDKHTLDMFKKTNAELQREYRKRQKALGGHRLDMRIDKDTLFQMEALGAYHNMTKKELVSFAIDKMYQAMNRKISRERSEEVRVTLQLDDELRQTVLENEELDLLDSLEG